MSSDDESNRLARLRLEYERLWNYFSYHAEQRIKTFHLFLVITGLISSGLAIIFAKAGIFMPKKENLTDEVGTAIGGWGYYYYPAKQRTTECCEQIKIALENIKEVISSTSDITRNNIEHLPNILIIMLILGALLIFFSWIFWMLDKRNHTLVSIAREQLLEMEKKEFFEYEIFSLVEKDIKINDPMRFKSCLKYIYLVIGFIGAIIAVFSICKLLQ